MICHRGFQCQDLRITLMYSTVKSERWLHQQCSEDTYGPRLFRETCEGAIKVADPIKDKM